MNYTLKKYKHPKSFEALASYLGYENTASLVDIVTNDFKKLDEFLRGNYISIGEFVKDKETELATVFVQYLNGGSGGKWFFQHADKDLAWTEAYNKVFSVLEKQLKEPVLA
jgi:hypothetical protein